VITLGSVAIAAFITPIVGPAMADLLAPIIGSLISISVNNYCSTDPPADPGLTAQDVENAILIPPNANTLSAQAKIVQWFESQYWHQICECTSVPTPAPGTPSNPGGATSNPGLPGAGSTAPCWNVQQDIKVPAGPGIGPGGIDVGNLLLPSSSPTITVTPPGQTNAPSCTAQTVQAGANTLQMTMIVNAQGGAGSVYAVQFDFWNSSGTHLSSFTSSINGVGTGSNSPVEVFTLPSGTAYWSADAFTTGNSFDATVKFSFFCSGTGPGGLSTPCCPPDPLLEGKLDLLIQLVKSIQIASPSTAWTDGAVHSALSGNGSFVFSGKPSGIRFNVTTPPSPASIIPGTPNFYWDMGFVTPIGNATPLRGWRLVYLSESFVLPVYADSIGYTLLHGTVANATELLPA